jgi:hypothetical protein
VATAGRKRRRRPGETDEQFRARCELLDVKKRVRLAQLDLKATHDNQPLLPFAIQRAVKPLAETVGALIDLIRPLLDVARETAHEQRELLDELRETRMLVHQLHVSHAALMERLPPARSQLEDRLDTLREATHLRMIEEATRRRAERVDHDVPPSDESSSEPATIDQWAQTNEGHAAVTLLRTELGSWPDDAACLALREALLLCGDLPALQRALRRYADDESVSTKSAADFQVRLHQYLT